jgi:hypothetical protein
MEHVVFSDAGSDHWSGGDANGVIAVGQEVKGIRRPAASRSGAG